MTMLYWLRLRGVLSWLYPYAAARLSRSVSELLLAQPHRTQRVLSLGFRGTIQREGQMRLHGKILKIIV